MLNERESFRREKLHENKTENIEHPLDETKESSKEMLKENPIRDSKDEDKLEKIY